VIPPPRLVVGFQGTDVPAELRRLAARGWLAGVVIFARNLVDTPTWVALQRELLGLFPDDGPASTPILAVDQEGGLVQRLKPPKIPEIAPVPPMAQAAAALGPDGLTALGRAMGSELAALGFNLDFAPVLDVHTRPENPIIGERAFGTTAEAVIARALAWRAGLEAAGVVACGKHLPGHGDTRTDSHLELPVDPSPRARLEAEAFAPFRAAIAAGMDLLMTAHVRYPDLDDRWPATLSAAILSELVRGAWGYEGVLVSDDLEMGALADLRDPGLLAERLDAATVDLALVCSDLAFAEALGDALAQRPEDPRQSVRLARLRARLRRHVATFPLMGLVARPARAAGDA
jgi:beta-N-acetylhexosaminidase